jgi:hypothetical protein
VAVVVDRGGARSASRRRSAVESAVEGGHGVAASCELHDNSPLNHEIDITVGVRALEKWLEEERRRLCSSGLAQDDNSKDFASFFTNVLKAVKVVGEEDRSGFDVFFSVSFSAKARLMERFVRTSTMLKTGCEGQRYSAGTMRSMLNEMQVWYYFR